MPRADSQSPRRVDNSNRAHDILEVRQRLAHSHEHDVIDLLAALALDRDDLVDNLVWFQISTEPVQTARAEFAAISAADLRRNTDGSSVRPRSVERGRCRNQDRLNQAFVI